jgi:hypothetical protein
VRRDPDQVRPSDRRRGPSRTTRGGRATARALAAQRTSSGRASKRRSSDGRGTSSGASARRASSTRTRAGAQRGQSRSAGARMGRGRARPSPEMTKAELYRLAQSAEVPNRSTMSKSELLRALEQQRR